MSGTERLDAALAGRYRIERELGQGGMATVYLAEDLKHKRKVALKVLKPELAAVLGAERFVQEITTTASLQHPHILPLFDSGTADGFLYYVMPYMEGETLRGKLDRETQLGVDEAVRITTQVADALDYAHRHGVIHRDIKPENILLHDGRPTVADFGIALAVSAAAGGRMTETGLSLGTPHYMSPEQATAEKAITGRSDIYSLASVMYEMLTGNPPHVGSSAQQIIMKIIAEPVAPVTTHRKSVPPNVAAALAQALEKLPADRFESATDFAQALVNRTFTSATWPGDIPRQARGIRGMLTPPFIAVLSVAVMAVIAAVIGWQRPTPSPNVSRFAVALPDSQGIALVASGDRVAISPDGRAIAYVGQGSTARSGHLWVRALDQLSATPLAGTEDASDPAFSPDGKRIAFISNGVRTAVKVVQLGGGPPLTLTDSLVDGGAVSWSTDGYIYYDGHLEGDGVARVRETGGNPEVVSRPDSARSELYHYATSVLPDGRGVIMTIAHPGDRDRFEVGVVDTRSGRHKTLVRGVAGMYVASGHLLYLTADATLMAVPFDADRLVLAGDAVVLEAGVSNVSVSLNGVLLYVAGEPPTRLREAVWVSPSGAITPVDSSWRGALRGRPTLSPDARQVAIVMSPDAGRQVWVKQLDRGPASRVADPGRDPVWLPDGRTLLFVSPDGLARVPADGSTLPVPSRVQGRFLDYSRDGKWIVLSQDGNIAAMRAEGDTAARVVVDDPGSQVLPALSPDGRWLAYMSDETGVMQVYVRPFPDTKGARRQVSLRSGLHPRWSRSGHELYFINELDDELVSVSVAPGPVFQAGPPQRLFSTRPFASYLTSAYDVAPDGRFLFLRDIRTGPQRDDELIVVQNFFEELKARVPRK